MATLQTLTMMALLSRISEKTNHMENGTDLSVNRPKGNRPTKEFL
ncbi:hypothetical protein [Diplocloster agilis]|nr:MULTISPECIES: hypothetical protein [Lachnospiraceae]MCU6732270.1 hypothetical protein [Suonthocola fibrivorans]